jgi:hypothetical protein
VASGTFEGDAAQSLDAAFIDFRNFADGDGGQVYEPGFLQYEAEVGLSIFVSRGNGQNKAGRPNKTMVRSTSYEFAGCVMSKPILTMSSSRNHEGCQPSDFDSSR